MTDHEVKELMRVNGLCGHLTDGQVCIMLRAHDDGVHDRGWTIHKTVEEGVPPRDFRDSTTYHHVSDGTKTFTTTNEAHAQWLASTLTRLDL